jgi:hypothetical protein
MKVNTGLSEKDTVVYFDISFICRSAAIEILFDLVPSPLNHVDTIGKSGI